MPNVPPDWKPPPPSSTFGRRFLAGVDPSADRAAPPCGPHELRLKIAALPLELVGMGDDEADSVRRLYGRELRESPAGPRIDRDPRDDWQVRFHRAPAEAFRDPRSGSGEETGEKTETSWTDRLDLVAAQSHVRIAGPGWVTRILRRERSVEAHLGPPGDDVAVADILRLTVAFAALERGALLLRAAAIHRQDRVAVFPGHDAAEKQALCSIARRLGDEILADDLVLLWPHVPAAEQVPFPARRDDWQPHPGRRSLAAILPLEGSAADDLPEIGWAGLWSRLVGAAILVNADPWSTDRLEELVARTLGFCDEPRGLSFRTDGELPVLEEILGPPGLPLGTVS